MTAPGVIGGEPFLLDWMPELIVPSGAFRALESQTFTALDAVDRVDVANPG